MAVIPRPNRENPTSYAVSIYVGHNERRWIDSFRVEDYGGKRAAKLAAEKAEAEAKTNRRRTPKTLTTCDEFRDRWLEQYPRAAAGTKSNYRYATKKFAEDFKGVKLTDVDRPTARKWANTVPLKNVQTVRTMFADAMNDGLVEQNPFASLRIAQSRGRRDIEVLTEQEVMELAHIAEKVHGNEVAIAGTQDYGQVFGAWIVFAAYTCMRPGEIRALEWRNVDFQKQEIDVQHSIDRQGNVKRPKNGKPRTIILPPPAAKALHRVPRDVRSPYVFRSKRGGVFTQQKLSHYWSPVRAAFRAKHPDRALKDPYELRHFGATLLLEKGVSPADVAVQMGHTDGGRLVQTLYGHPSDQAARERLKAAFGQNVKPLRAVQAAKENTG